MSRLRTRVAPGFVRLILTVGLLAAAGGCAPGGDGAGGADGRVVLYVSADPHVFEPVVAAFEAETGVEVAVRTDTEATKTTGLVQRLRAEAARPAADVLWSSEVFLTIRLADEGLLAPHESAAVASWPEPLRDPERRWHGFALRARVLVYNTDRLTRDEVPADLHGVLRPRFASRFAMARPQFGTTRGHMAALVAMWGEAAAASWMADVAGHGVRLYDGNASVVRAVAAGEADVGLTDTDDVWAGQRNGWPVELVYARHDLPAASDGGRAFGPLVIPNTVARVRGGPNPEAAARLIDFLLSERVERMLAESDSHNVPVRPGLAAEFERYRVPDPESIDYEDVAAAMPRAMELCDGRLR